MHWLKTFVFKWTIFTTTTRQRSQGASDSSTVSGRTNQEALYHLLLPTLPPTTNLISTLYLPAKYCHQTEHLFSRVLCFFPLHILEKAISGKPLTTLRQLYHKQSYLVLAQSACVAITVLENKMPPKKSPAGTKFLSFFVVL